MTAIGYSVDVNQDQVADALSLFQFLGGNTSDALRISINRAGPRIRTKASSAIRDQVRLKASYVNQRLKFIKATRQKLEGRISAPSRGLLLSRYSTDKSAGFGMAAGSNAPPVPKRGIRVKVKPGNSPKQLSGRPGEIKGKPFYMILPNSGALGLAGRRATPGKKGGLIKVFYGSSLSQVYSDVRADVLDDSAEILQFEYLDAMRFLLQKKYPRE